MYNEELKLRFIREITSSISVAEKYVSFFNFIQKFENEKGADICAFTQEDIRPVLESAVGTKTLTKQNIFNQLKNYTSWCIDNNVKGANANIDYSEITGYNNIRTKMVTSPLSLNRYLDRFCDAVDLNTVTNTYRCYLWMAFAGIKKEDVFKVTSNDVDFNSMSVIINGKEYPIYREAIGAFRYCCKSAEFTDRHTNYKDTVVIARTDLSESILRGAKSIPNEDTFQVNMARLLKSAGVTDTRITYEKAFMSGVFYRMHEMEQAGFEIDFSAVADDFLKGRTYKTDVNRRSLATTKRYLLKNYMKDYEAWKMAFNL